MLRLVRFGFRIFLLLVLALVAIWNLGTTSGPVAFNQHYIDALDRLHGATSTRGRLRALRSELSQRWSSLFPKPPVPTNFDDVASVFEYVLAYAPPYALVHPTEMYFYYAFDMPGVGRISGNVRLVEAKNLRVGCGYFPVNDPSGKSAHKLFSPADGLNVEWLNAQEVALSFRGWRRTFRLSDLANRPTSAALREGEKVIATVRDESGVIFVLLFHQPTKAFYYLLDEQQPVLEDLTPLSDEIDIGERTGFAFFRDSDRKRRVLMGVKYKSVQENTYFDGPFDQVPPFLHLRDMVYLSYPYTKFGGVDLYGNFLNSESTRVAISPYLKYTTPADLSVLLADCRTGKAPHSDDLLSCLTYEDKRDFHRDSPMFTPDGELLPPEQRKERRDSASSPTPTPTAMSTPSRRAPQALTDGPPKQ